MSQENKDMIVNTSKLDVTNTWPKECEIGLIKTMNSMGIMTSELSPLAVEFIEQAKHTIKPILDIGAAYGVTTHPALYSGAKVIACDISKTHLEILKNTAPKDTEKRLTLTQASFPFETNFNSSSIGCILISLVLHFLDGETTEIGLKKCYDWLEPGGKIYLVVMTPNLSFYKKAWPEYRKNIAKGRKWPGIFETRDLVTNDIIDFLPPMVHLFEKNILERAVKAAGFEIERSCYFCYKNFPDIHRNNGKEFLGVVGVK
ncbi:MAG: class I SAM-dependent methyltransferase [Tatlockia sp.]|nr:class I SAM-dependent methyltransferase [Tatlockia sp.]